MSAIIDKLREKGIVVRSEVDQNENDFSKDYYIIYEKDEKGDIVLNKKGEPIPEKDKKGNIKLGYTYTERDVYIQCVNNNREDKIFIDTIEVPYLREHTFQVYISSLGRGLNILRNYCIDVLSTDKGIIYYVENEVELREELKAELETRKKEGKRLFDIEDKIEKRKMWDNDKMVEIIKKEGIIFDIEILDGDVLFKTNDFDLLEKLLSIKKVKGKSPTPFADKYLLKIKYDIPPKDDEEYREAIESKFGVAEFGTPERLEINRKIKNMNNEYLDIHKITKDTKRKSKIWNNKELIHSIGLWEDYLNYIKAYTVA